MLEVLEMKRLRYRQKKKLNKPNKLLFNNMTMHIFNSTITYKEKEIALQQILDILLQAQQEHRSGEIVFENPYKFCEELIDEYGSSNSLIYKFLYKLQKSLLTFLIFIVLVLVLNMFFHSNAQMRLDLFVMPVGLCFILYPNIHRNRFLFGALFLGFCMFMSSMLLMEPSWAKYNNISIEWLVFILTSSVIIVLLIELYKQIYKKLKGIKAC